MSNSSHQERTVDEEREKHLHRVVVNDVTELLAANVRLIRLGKITAEQHIKFLPGQWLDVYVPGSTNPGGFTITSTPQDASLTGGFIELAIQSAPGNPSAAWFWQQPTIIKGQEVSIRVGGSFVWPPPSLRPTEIVKVVFVAGGVGINPLMAILSHLHQTSSLPPSVRFMYSSKTASASLDTILFSSRLAKVFSQLQPAANHLELFLTSPIHAMEAVVVQNQYLGADVPMQARQASPVKMLHDSEPGARSDTKVYDRRISQLNLLDTLGPVQERSRIVIYVCGPPSLTDWAVDTFRAQPGVNPANVLCEKWW